MPSTKTNKNDTEMARSPPSGIPTEHIRMTKGPRRNSCEARPGLIESTHIAPLDGEVEEEEMVEAPMVMAMGPRALHPMDSPPMGIDEAHVRPIKGPRRNSCEAHPGLIESTHLAPLNEGLMAPDRKKKEGIQTIRMRA